MTPEQRAFFIEYIEKGKNYKEKKDSKDYLKKKIERFENIEIAVAMAKVTLAEWEGFVNKETAEKIRHDLAGIESSLKHLTDPNKKERKSGEIKTIEERIAKIQKDVEKAVSVASKETSKSHTWQVFKDKLQKFKADHTTAALFASHLSKIEAAIKSANFENVSSLFNTYISMVDALKIYNKKIAETDTEKQTILKAKNLLVEGKVPDALSLLGKLKDRENAAEVSTLPTNTHTFASLDLLKKRNDIKEQLNLTLFESMALEKKLKFYISQVRGLNLSGGAKLKAKYVNDLNEIEASNKNFIKLVEDSKDFREDEIEDQSRMLKEQRRKLDEKKRVYESIPSELSEWNDKVAKSLPAPNKDSSSPPENGTSTSTSVVATGVEESKLDFPKSQGEFDKKKKENKTTLDTFVTFAKKIKGKLPKAVLAQYDEILLAADAMAGDANLTQYTENWTTKLRLLDTKFAEITKQVADEGKMVFTGDNEYIKSKLKELDTGKITVDDALEQIQSIQKFIVDSENLFKKFDMERKLYEKERLDFVAKTKTIAAAYKYGYTQALEKTAADIPTLLEGRIFKGERFRTYGEFSKCRDRLDAVIAQVKAIDTAKNKAQLIIEKEEALKKESIKNVKLKDLWEATSTEFETIKKNTEDAIKKAEGNIGQVKQLDTLKGQAEEVAKSGDYATALQIFDDIRSHARYLQECPQGIMVHTRKQLEADVKTFHVCRHKLQDTLGTVAEAIGGVNKDVAPKIALKIKEYSALLETSVLDNVGLYNTKIPQKKEEHKAEMRRLREIHLKEISRLESILNTPLARKIRAYPVQRSDINTCFEKLFIILDSLKGNILTAI